MDYPVGLIKGSVKGNEGTLAIFDLGECVGTCQFRYENQDVFLLNLRIGAFINKEVVLDSITKWALNQGDAVITVEYHPSIGEKNEHRI